LIADRELSSLETTLREGSVPAVGETIKESEPYTIRRTITDYLPPFERGEEDDGLRGRDDPVIPSLFAAPNAREAGALRKIDIHVSWLEAENERAVVRTTFGIDLAVAGAKLLSSESERQ
jgi:hypothetical protein